MKKSEYENLTKKLRDYAGDYCNGNPYDIPGVALQAADAIEALQKKLSDAIEALRNSDEVCSSCVHNEEFQDCELNCDVCTENCMCAKCSGNNNWEWDHGRHGGD